MVRRKCGRWIAGGLAGIAGLTLLGCPHQPGDQVEEYPDPLGLEIGRTVTLNANLNPYESRAGWKFQWQQILRDAEDGTLVVSNLPNGADRHLVFRKLTVADANLYRCMMYKEGEFPETNYTTLYSLQISGQSAALAVATTVSGSFKPGSGGGTACGQPYKDGLVFKNPTTGNWWIPTTTGGMVTIRDDTQIDYKATPVCFEVVDQTFKGIYCHPMTNSMSTFQFPNNRPGYMFCLCFTGTPPPTGQKFTFEVTW